MRICKRNHESQIYAECNRQWLTSFGLFLLLVQVNILIRNCSAKMLLKNLELILWHFHATKKIKQLIHFQLCPTNAPGGHRQLSLSKPWSHKHPSGLCPINLPHTILLLTVLYHICTAWSVSPDVCPSHPVQSDHGQLHPTVISTSCDRQILFLLRPGHLELFRLCNSY